MSENGVVVVVVIALAMRVLLLSVLMYGVVVSAENSTDIEELSISLDSSPELTSRRRRRDSGGRRRRRGPSPSPSSGGCSSDSNPITEISYEYAMRGTVAHTGVTVKVR